MPTKSVWTWDDHTKRYRNTVSGRFLGSKQMIELRDTFLDVQKDKARQLIDSLADGRLTLQEWTLQQRTLIRQTYIDEYVMAHGGRGTMTQRDWGILGQQIKEQYGYLAKFEQDLRNGKLSPGQAGTRASMYVESASQAFERGRGETMGVPKLPAYPGDGSTVCRANCRCHWEIVPTDSGWDCTWSLGAAEHCPDCISNAGRWAPLRVPRLGGI